jgi:hypothetical protein
MPSIYQKGCLCNILLKNPNIFVRQWAKLESTLVKNEISVSIKQKPTGQ